MKLADFVPPVMAQFGASVMRSLASNVARFARGDDLVDAPKSRLIEPYAQSAWVRDAVHKVAGPISGRPLKFYQGETEFEAARLAEFWKAPALGPKTASGKAKRLKLEQVLFDLAAWERLEGEFFIVLDDAWLLATASRLGASLPPFLIPNPQRMQVVLHGGELAAWRYSDPAGRQHHFLPEQVIHRKSFNPYDDWRGVGALQASKVAAEGAFLTGVYVRDLARNNGDQGMVVVAKGGVVNQAQRDQLLADLRAKRAALNRGQARDILVVGDIAVDRPEEQAASEALMNSKAMSHEEIFVAFGLPPSMAALKQSYSVGKESDKYQAITDTCMPVGNTVAGALAEVASLQAGRELTGELDWDDHPVMIEVRNSRLDALTKVTSLGMPVKDANDYLGLGMKPYPGWEVGYLPFSVAPVDAVNVPATEPTQDPALQELPPAREDPEVARIRLLVLARAKARQCINVTPGKAEGGRRKAEGRDPLADFVCECGGAAAVAMKARSAKEIAQWRELMSKRRATVQSFKGAFGRVLMQARAETLRKIESLAAKSVVAKATATELLFDLAKFSEAFLRAMAAQQRSALDAAGAQLFAEVGKDDPFKYPGAEVLNFLASRQNKLSDTPTAIHEEIKAALEEGLLAGETTSELAARVRSAFNGVSSQRALRIAMTETAAAYGAGRDEAMVQAGVQYKRWLTSGGDNVRSAHADANGQTVPVDQPFEVGGEALMFPGDDAGSAENVINCHCVSIAVASEDAS